jgi:hypothetical protein
MLEAWFLNIGIVIRSRVGDHVNSVRSHQIVGSGKLFTRLGFIT